MKIRHPVLIFFVVLAVFFDTAEAKIFHWPNHCDKGTLQVTNSSNENHFVWLQSFTDKLESETEFEIESHSTLNISVERLFSEERNSLLQFADKMFLNTKFNCNKSFFKTDDLDGGKIVFTRSKSPHHKLFLQNLTSLNNSIEVSITNSNNQTLHNKKISLSSSETYSLALDEFQNWRSVEVNSDLKYSAFVLTDSGNAIPQQTPPTGNAKPDGSYFLVGVRENEDDSFVVKITDTKLIAQARELVAKPELEKIVFAKIEKGHQFYNRNFNNKSKSFWSWSTSEVTGFGDFGSTSCNGHPQAVEDRLDAWLNNPGRICFWDYRIKKELTIEELNSGLLKP